MLHAPEVRFTNPPFQTWHGVARRAKTAETAPVFISLRRGKPFHSAMKHFRFRSNMKHSAYAAYDEKMKNESFLLQYTPCSVILTVERKTPMEKTSNKLVELSVVLLMTPHCIMTATAIRRKDRLDMDCAIAGLLSIISFCIFILNE